jgi:hypothetical protein
MSYNFVDAKAMSFIALLNIEALVVLTTDVQSETPRCVPFREPLN